jgi:hypothetical protein
MVLTSPRTCYDKGVTLEPTKLTEAMGYRIVVSPASFDVSCWEFIVLMPPDGQEAENIVTVKELCDGFLDEEDMYSIYPFTHEDQVNYQPGDPILSYDPLDPENFTWIYGPRHKRH